VRLSKFILSNLEEILKEWESFASTVLPGKQFDKAMLRNDAAEILKAIAKDMETPQTASQQTVKSKGRDPKKAQDTSAERHSLVRLGQGFNQVQALSEFRALRATVIRIWMNSSPQIDDSAIYQLIRFNEGIDQALSESAARFMEQIEQSRILQLLFWPTIYETQLMPSCRQPSFFKSQNRSIELPSVKSPLALSIAARR
jgi:hypothetical protein